MDVTTEQAETALPNSDSRLFKGRFPPSNNHRLPRVTEISPEDASQPIRLGPGTRESKIAYTAYCLYRDAGPARSIRATAGRLGKPVEQLERWSRVWQWGWRCALHDLRMNQEHGLPIGRERAMAMAKKIEKFGPDPRYWSRQGRTRMPAG